MFANTFFVQHRMFMDCFWVSTSKLVCQRIHPVSFVRMNFMTLWWEKEEWIMDPELYWLTWLAGHNIPRSQWEAQLWCWMKRLLDSSWLLLDIFGKLLPCVASTSYHCISLHYSRWTKFDKIFKPCNTHYVDPPSPKSQCFSAIT